MSAQPTPALALRHAVLCLPIHTRLADRWPPPEHSASHRSHWSGWLADYDGPGYYNRRVPKVPRSMAYIYGHIHCAPMLLWLAEAAGVPAGAVREADGVLRALTGQGLSESHPRAGIAVRKVLPWSLVEAALVRRGLIEADA